MTVGDWLASTALTPPPALAARIGSAIGPRVAEPIGDAPRVFMNSALALVDELAARGCAQRDDAIDLLAADALMTYAFEAAADTPDSIAVLAEEAIGRLAHVAAAEDRPE